MGDFNDDGVVDSTEQNPIYTYNSIGNYTVSLTAIGMCGAELEEVTEEKIDYINVTSTSSDTTPDTFTFTDVTDATLSTEYISNTITVSGIDSASPISITGGEYRINGGAWTSASGNVNNGDTVEVRQTSSSSNSTKTDTILTIGGVSDTYSVTTIDTTPPIISEVISVPNITNDRTPNYTFTTNEAGTITYGGSCTSATTTAVVGNNTVTFNTLANGVYSNCTITIRDAAGNISNVLIVSEFEVRMITETCGNNVIEGFEQCDDGNLTNGDGCSSTCQDENGDNDDQEGDLRVKLKTYDCNGNEESKKIVGSKVKLYERDGDKVETDKTNSKGEANFRDIETGKYKVKCEVDGYVSMKDKSKTAYESGYEKIKDGERATETCRLIKNSCSGEKLAKTGGSLFNYMFSLIF